MKACNLPFLNVYFKIIKKNLGSLIIYICIFLGIASLLSQFGYNSYTGGSFTEAKSSIAFINYDTGSELTSGIKDSLSKNAVFVNIKDDRQNLQDALFFRKVTYIVKVPKGFSSDFLAGKDVKLEKTHVSDSADGVYMDMIINRYLNLARMHAAAEPGISQKALANAIKTDMSVKTDISVKNFGGSTGMSDKATHTFDFMAYALICIMFLGISTIMIVFEQKDLNYRNLSAPVRPLNIKAQLLLGNFILMLILLVFVLISSCVIGGVSPTNKAFPLLCANAFCFAFVCLAIGFLVGSMIKKRAAQQAVCNVLSLGLSFLGGVFVPQYLLGESVLSISRFLPSYWYVKATDEIGALSSYSGTVLNEIWSCMAIQLGFAAALLIVAAAMTKRKRAGNT